MPPLAPVMLVEEHAPIASARPAPAASPGDWQSLIAACPSKSLQGILVGLTLEKLEHARITLRVPHAFAKMVDLRREEIAMALGRAAGRPLALECIVESAPTTPAPSAPGREGGEPARPHGGPAAVLPPRAAPQPLPASSMSDHPLVRQAAELLNARLIRVERRESSND